MGAATAPPVEAAPAPAPEPAAPAVNYLNASYGVWSWLTTKDHKRIGLLYLVVVTIFFMLGGVFALLCRLELLTPEADVFQADTYNRLFTMHGIAMIFFFMIPSIPAVLGNFVLPIMIGAKDVAFPRLNLLSWYIFVVGALLSFYAMIRGGVDTGWTFYVPYATIATNSYVTTVGLGIFVAGFSSILTGLNMIVTVHTLRAPGLTWFRMPLFVWSMYAASVVMVLGTPVIAITMLMIAMERTLGLPIFDPSIGGDPVLFQHLFWFYSHPAVYIMILPAMGVISELVAAFARKRIYGYNFVALSSVSIAGFGFLGWAHHMFVSGMSPYASLFFSFLTFIVAVPSAVKTFNWTATLYKGSVSFETPMVYVFGFLGFFLIGGLSGLFLASVGLDVHVHDTYWVVAHFHYIMVGGVTMGYLGGLHYWWPKITGKLYSEALGRIAAITIFIGFNLTFFPQFLAGYLGMPRRYNMYPPEFQVYNVLSSAGASILGLGYLFPLVYLFWSMRYGKPAGPNPWGAVGLEWETSSPPPVENFHETPEVRGEAYDYSARGTARG